jgi:hypothetical protein
MAIRGNVNESEESAAMRNYLFRYLASVETGIPIDQIEPGVYNFRFFGAVHSNRDREEDSQPKEDAPNPMAASTE